MTWRIKVLLEDGPAAGRRVEYFTPLPNILVVATKNGHIAWHDYRRVGDVTYRYVEPCPKPDTRSAPVPGGLPARTAGCRRPE